MAHDEHDLPERVTDALRDVPRADPATMDAHIAAALGAWDREMSRPARVISLDARRRVLLSAAAAFLLIVGAGLGWVVHSPHVTPVAADASTRSQSDVAADAAAGSVLGSTVPDSVVPKGSGQVAAAQTSRCELSLVAGAVLIGTITSGDDTYTVVQMGSRINLYRGSDCSIATTYTLP